MFLAYNFVLLACSGWTMVYNRAGRGGIDSYELSPPVDFAPTADVKIALRRALRLPKAQAHWIALGEARGTRSVVFDSKGSSNAYINAVNAGKELMAKRRKAEMVEGREGLITLIAPKSAINSA